MRIGIDARMYGAHNGGIGRYIEQLILQLEALDTRNEYYIFLRQENWGEYTPQNIRFHKIFTNIPWYSWKEQLYFPRLLKKYQLDLVHFPHWNVPFFYTQPFVVTIHDLIMYHFPRPEATTHGRLLYWLKDRFHRVLVHHAVKKANHVLTVSNFSKEDIIKTLHADPNKIAVTYLAPTHVPASPPPSSNAQPYFLYVGTAYPHKNLPALLQAWQLFEHSHPDYHLVLAGRKNYFYERLLESKEMKDCKNVRFAGFVSDSELPALYRHATGYIIPSLYEGFGLPPLEAMEYGVPVVAANSSCLPEILGDAALFFNPTLPEDLAATLSTLINNKQAAAHLRQRGFDLLKKYSWKSTAETTLQLYEQATS